MPPQQLTLSLLGSFHVAWADRPVSFATASARALLAYLAVETGRLHSREVLAGLFWPDQRQAAAYTNLRATLARVRKALPELSAGTAVLHVTQHTLQLNCATATAASDTGLVIRVDVAEFEDLLAECAVHSHPNLTDCPDCIRRLEQAAQLYRGDFLNGLSLHQSRSQPFEEWMLVKREALHQKALKILQVLANHYEAVANYDQVCHHAARQLALESWLEAAHVQMMRALVHSGQRAAALAQYDTCQHVLRDELGIEPMPETTALFQRIQAGSYPEIAVALAAAAALAPAPPPGQDWSDVPQTGLLYGRQAEVARLESWLLGEQPCRLVSVLGFGGTGKTALAAAVSRAVANRFDRVMWRSLINAPSLADVLREALQTLSGHRLTHLPILLDEQLALLVDYMRQHHCLLVLDNLESIVQQGNAGAFRAGYESYGQLIQSVVESQHNSCVVLTSREQPRDVTRLGDRQPRVRTLHLSGLDTAAGQTMLAAHGLAGQRDQTQSLIEHYSGNPLALKLVAQVVHDLFNSDIAAFLAADAPIFDDIRTVLDQQYEQLAPLEREILTWLAIEREPTRMAALRENLVEPVTPRDFIESLLALQRRSLIEQRAGAFSLQNVILEYATDRLVNEVYRVILHEKDNASGTTNALERLDVLNRYALLKAKAPEYVRQSQSRLILQSVATRLLNKLGQPLLMETLRRILAMLREQSSRVPGYAGGNILNVLLCLGVDVRGMDFSRLTVWQAFLQEKSLLDVNLGEADLSRSVFTDTFSAVRSLAYTGDGQLLAAATSLGDIRLWHAPTGQPAGILRGHSKLVMCVAASSDGRFLASGGEDGTVRVWGMDDHIDPAALRPFAAQVPLPKENPGVNANANGMASSRVIYQSEAIVRAVAFRPHGAVLASAADDAKVRLWNAETGRCLAILDGHSYVITSLAFSPDGRLLASCSGDHTIRVWDVSGFDATGEIESAFAGSADNDTRGRLLWQVPPEAGEFWSLAFSPDGALLVGGTLDGMILVWKVGEGFAHGDGIQEPARAWQAHPSNIVTLAFSPDGKTLATGSNDCTIRLWQVRTGELLNTLQSHTQGIFSIAYSPLGDALASGSADRTIRLWDVQLGAPFRIIAGHARPLTAVAFTPSGNGLVSGSGDGLVRLWDVAGASSASSATDAASPLTNTCRHTLTGHADGIWSVAVSPNGQTIASASEDRTVRLWNAHTGQAIDTVAGHGHIVTALAFNPHGTLLASASLDQIIQLWDVGTGASVARLERDRVHSVHNGIWSVAFDPEGRTLAAGYSDGAIALWDVPSRRIRQVLHRHGDWVRSLAFSPDGALLLSGSNDQAVCLWDARTGDYSRTLHGHTDWVMSVVFSPDGALLASGGHDQVVRLWRTNGDEEPAVASLVGHENGILSLAFHPNGAMLVSASQDETMRFWDVAARRCCLILRAPGPYSGMNITGATGISESQKIALTTLGAVTQSV